MKREDLPLQSAVRYRRSCPMCGIRIEDEEHECSVEDLMESAGRNADDQIGVYG